MKKFINSYSELPKNLFKKIFVLYAFGYLPFLLLHIVLNIFEILPVNYNDESVYGLKGVIVLICFTPFTVFLFSVLTWFNFQIGSMLLKLLNKAFYE